MEKRALIAIILSIIVLVLFSYLTPQRPVQKQVRPQPEETRVESQAKKEEQLSVKTEAAVPAAQALPSEEKEIKVETDFYSAVLSTKGGTIKKWGLKNFTEPVSKQLVQLLPSDAAIPPISVIPEGQPTDKEQKLDYIYNADRDSIILDSTVNKDTLTFSYADPFGFSIKKSFTFYKDSYKVDLTTEVKGAKSYYVVLGTEFGITDKKGTWVHIGPVLLDDSKKIDITADNIEGIGFFQRLTGKKSRDDIAYQGNIWWIAQEDKYFAAALASLSRTNDVRVWARGKDSKTQVAEIAYKVDGGKGQFLFYAGPKKYELLKTFGVGLEHIIDFGTFSIIARPLFWLLKFLYRLIGNYGWAIVLLTIITRIPFIPLLNKSQKSMKKLQDIQPHMAEIKERYKKDPQKMQKEMMGLYKKHKVNPVGGCLPMLIQMPVFLALYKILLIAVELRGAPFFLWITDLSAPDRLPIGIQIPYVGNGIPVLTLLMGATMVIQQKITPTTMDPQQAKIMMLMPIVFTFMFLNFPAGLVLYWLVNNTLGIIQQIYINKKSKVRSEK